MRSVTAFGRCYTVSLLLVAATCTASAQPPAVVSPTQYEVLTKGLLAGPIFPFDFASSKVRLEARNLVMGPGAADGVPVPAEMIVEVRGGAVQATVNGKTTGYVAGDFFVLEKGDTVRLENKNDVAVMRAIYVTTLAKKNEVK